MSVPASEEPTGRPSPSSLDLSTVHRLDWAILGAGALAFFLSFFSYYTASVSFGGYGGSVSVNAWHGFFGWFAMLCALAGSATVAMALFVPQVTLPLPHRLAGLGLYGVATLCVVLALFVFPGGRYGGTGVDTGHGFGYWISLIAIIAGLMLSLLRMRQRGDQLPGALSKLGGGTS